jgi:hypothetical protein
LSHETDPRIEDAFVTRAPRVAVVISDNNPQLARYDHLMTAITARVISGELQGAEAEQWIAQAEEVRDAGREWATHPIFPTAT